MSRRSPSSYVFVEMNERHVEISIFTSIIEFSLQSTHCTRREGMEKISNVFYFVFSNL